MKDKQEFHTRLLTKIQEAGNTPEFAASKTGASKLTRTLQLLGGTSPEVLVDVLGITDIPDDPWKAMNMVRNMDIATVRALEVFVTSGKGKQVGHHLTPGNILGKHLLGMPPADRYDVFKGLMDMGRKHGMDPRQIVPLLDSIHFDKAHGKDFSGKKTGALLEVIKGEKGVDFLKRFESALEAQDALNVNALADPKQQAYQAAYEGAAKGLDVPEVNLGGVETPPAMRKLGTEILKPSAEQVRTLVETSPDASPEQIRAGTEQIVRDTPLTKGQQKKLGLLQVANGQMKLNPKALAAAGLMLPSFAGLAASAAETTMRTQKAAETGNPLDKLQAGIAGTSLAADAVPGVGEVVSTPADLANVAIDEGREAFEDPMAYTKRAVERTAQTLVPLGLGKPIMKAAQGGMKLLFK
jgi:hypothetical protein